MYQEKEAMEKKDCSHIKDDAQYFEPVKEESNDVAIAETKSNESQDSITAQDYISSQLQMEREAMELMPYDPNSCTYSTGSIRQQIYACMTCYQKTNQLAGICYSCSIQCHSDHELVELFTKRNFTCDCGTTKINHPCSLRSNIKDDIPSSSNEYNQNFKGLFCHCAQPYNPLEENSNMLQCILGDVCQEDWYHDYCIMGLSHYEAPSNSEDHGVNKLDQLGEPEMDAQAQNEKNKEAQEPQEEYEDEGEPVLYGFPSLDDFDCYICWKCVNKHKDFFDKIKHNKDIVVTTVQRIESDDSQDRNAKILQNEYHDGFFRKKRKIDYDYSIFLKQNYEENFTKLYNSVNDSIDSTIRNFLNDFQFLMNDDPIYEPPNDDDATNDDDNSSIYDLGAKAINSLPREQAIQGVQAFQDIKDKLKNFLAPFAQDGKIVGKDDVEKFFQEIKR